LKGTVVPKRGSCPRLSYFAYSSSTSAGGKPSSLQTTLEEASSRAEEADGPPTTTTISSSRNNAVWRRLQLYQQAGEEEEEERSSDSRSNCAAAFQWMPSLEVGLNGSSTIIPALSISPLDFPLETATSTNSCCYWS
jgi:hypothetical protein